MAASSDPKMQETMISPADEEAIRKACLDYAEGWYSGDAERMGRCLHVELVKRSIAFDETRKRWQLTPPRDAAYMVSLTREGGGYEAGKTIRECEVTILDAYRSTASAKVISQEYVDYVQLARFEDGWKIVNVLWEYLEGEGE